MINLILILILSFILVKAADILIINFKSFSERVGLNKFALVGLILGLATSLPELFVGLGSAFEGRAILSLGNIIGANIANISLVIGSAALIGGKIFVRDSFLKRDVFYAFLAATTPMLLLSDKSLSRIDGIILIILYILYQLLVFNEHKSRFDEKENFYHHFLRKINTDNNSKKEFVWIIFGIILLLLTADVLVKIAVKLALTFNLPLLLVGLLIVAVGTTLPELVFSIEALRKKQSNMVFGNLLGSIVANGTLIIGLAVLISPVKIQSAGNYFLSTMAFLLIFVFFYLFIRTKKRLDRWEGGVLLLIYLLFVFLEFYNL